MCRSAEAEELGEVRANAFAAAFLLPEDGARNFLANLGKGSPSRPLETVFAEGGRGPYTIVEGRLPPHSQEIGILELNLLADYFKVSRECALWRLFNLRPLTENQRDEMLTLLKSGAWQPERPHGVSGPTPSAGRRPGSEAVGATAPAADRTADRRTPQACPPHAAEGRTRGAASRGDVLRQVAGASQAGETDAAVKAMVAARTRTP